MYAWGAALAAVVGIATWPSRREVVCHCVADEQLIAALRSQLDRCGPQNLTVSPPLVFEPAFFTSGVFPWFLAGVSLGGLLVACSLWALAARIWWSPSDAASRTPAAPSPSGSGADRGPRPPGARRLALPDIGATPSALLG